MRIASLQLYPLKSARGLALDRAHVDVDGLAGDRRWMVVDADGRFLTQRDEPRLARLEAIPHSAGLTLSVDGYGTCHVDTPAADAPTLAVTVWRDTLVARHAVTAQDWLGCWLGREVRLVWQPSTDSRRPNPDWAPDARAVSFADAYPVLVANRASLAALNAAIVAAGGTAVPMTRFRPNIVIDGADAWAEDHWRTLRLGDIELALVKPCDRCVVTTTDQTTGARMGKEPLATLARQRRSADPRITGVLFGINGVPLRAGTLRTGDPVTVLATQTPWPLA